MSILHGISAAILKNVSSVKKQASRLHKSSERVFGQQHSLSQCQEAVAVANGFRSWKDVMNVAKRFSSSNEEPFWHLTERNDFQEKYLKTILQTRLSEVYLKPLLITGDLREAAELGTAQWFERMSFEKLPGLMLVDTQQRHLEDTFAGKSIQKMQIEDVMMRCRVIDARESVLNVAITANHEYWYQSIIAQMPSIGTLETLQKSLQLNALEVMLEAIGRAKQINRLGWLELHEVSIFLLDNNGFINRFYDNKTEITFKEEVELLRAARQEIMDNKEVRLTVTILKTIIDSLYDKEFSSGISIDHESKHIPTIVLFDSYDVASSLLAGVVLQMYERFYIPTDLTAPKERQRPILFYSEHHSPRLICRYIGHGTIFVSSALNRNSPIWKDNGVFNLLVTEAKDGYVSYAGRKIMVEQEGDAK